MSSLHRVMSAGFYSFATTGANAITSIIPNVGYVTGDINITIGSTGGEFGVTPGTVTIDGINAPVVSWTAIAIVVTVPAHIVGQFDVVVTRADAVVFTAYSAFTYLAVPTIQHSKVRRNLPPSPISIGNIVLSPEQVKVIKKFSFDIENPIRRMWIKEQQSDRLVSLGQIQTINEFIRVMWQALQIHRPCIVFEPAYPTYILDVEDRPTDGGQMRTPTMPEEVITWNVVRRTPGSIDHIPFAKSREIRPRIREELVYEPIILSENGEPEMTGGPGQVGSDKELSKLVGRQIEGQWYDNLIQFDIWSKDNKKAEQLCDYLENFMHDFHGMFIELGVNKLHFQSRIRDEFLLKWRNGLCNRSLLFFVRTETVRSGTVREIRKIHVDAEVRTYLGEIGKIGPGAFIESTRNMIIQKWVVPQQD